LETKIVRSKERLKHQSPNTKNTLPRFLARFSGGRVRVLVLSDETLLAFRYLRERGELLEENF